METHPQKAEDMPLGDGDLSVVVRTIDPILDQLFDGAIKGALHADDLVDIATRIRTILHEAVARRGGAMPAAAGRQVLASGPADSQQSGACQGVAGSAASGGSSHAGMEMPVANVAGDAPAHASSAGG